MNGQQHYIKSELATKQQVTVVIPDLMQGLDLHNGQRRNHKTIARFFARSHSSIVCEIKPLLAAKLFLQSPENFHSLAKVTAVEDGLASDGLWMRADPVEFAVDLSTIYMKGYRHLGLTRAELNKLASMVNPLLKAFNLKLNFSDTGRGYIGCPSIPNLITHSPDELIGKSINDFLPQGTDRAFWLRLMTEIQMTLHQCELNQARKNRGLGTVDGLWFWGQGDDELISNFRYQRVISNDEVVLGFAKHLNIPHENILKPLTDLLAQSPACESILFWSSQLKNLRENELFLAAMEHFTQIKKLLHVKNIASIELYPGDKHCYDISRDVLRTWWKPWRRK